VPKKRKKKARKAKPARRANKRRRAASLVPARGASATEIALAGLAHDIRTPLTGILALSELLLASDLPERERRWAAAMKDAASHLARLTTLVVDAAKAGSSRLVLHPESFALRDFIDTVAQSLKARAEGKALDVEISIAKNIPVRVTGDAVRLRSALENLIDNAVKFTERGGVSLNVEVAPGRGHRLRLTFTVADTGIGIVAADLKRLFKPFAQANETVARRFGGSGLGLAFAKRVAEAMGGSLTVKSRVGAGSTFRLSVLAERGAATGIVAPPLAHNPPALSVLCVEDNPYGRVVLNTVLGELGHRVTFAENGELAVAAVARGDFDVVLMDVALPGMDGFETTRRIRALPAPAGFTPVIGMSGRASEDDEAAAWTAGMDSYLRKPASPAILNAALAAVASQPPKRGQ
jgi:CheY-like chemotaxis protein/nitrogen-specific signal transduction histidine kinase